MTLLFFNVNDTATTSIDTSLNTLSLHAALPIAYGHPLHCQDGGKAGRYAAFASRRSASARACRAAHLRGSRRHAAQPFHQGLPRQRNQSRLGSAGSGRRPSVCRNTGTRSEEHTSELQSLMRISYAVFCLKKKKNLR